MSPAIAAIILVAVALAISIGLGGWLAGLTSSFANTEALHVVNDEWGSGCAHVDLTLRNGGTVDVVLNSLKLNSLVTDYNVVSGSESIGPEETVTVRVTYGFVVGNKYSFVFSTSSGYNFVFYSEAKLP